MKIETESGTLEIEPDRYVYDELSDTWVTWDLLDEPTIAHLMALVNEVNIATQAMRGAIKSAAEVAGMVQSNSKYVA